MVSLAKVTAIDEPAPRRRVPATPQDAGTGSGASGPGASRAPARDAATVALTDAALRRLEERHPWYSALEAQQRSAIAHLVGAGVATFQRWLARPGDVSVARDVLGDVPPELAGALSLEQTLEIIRSVADAIEQEAAGAPTAPGGADLGLGALRFSTEIAFSAARYYARAAEMRGAWDARLEATVVDALLRGSGDSAVLSRLAALGWGGATFVQGAVATSPPAPPSTTAPNVHELPGARRVPPSTPFGPQTTRQLRRVARQTGSELLVGVQGERLVLIVGSGSSEDLDATAHRLLAEVGDGPVVFGPVVTDVRDVGDSLRPALAALRTASAWPDSPRPLHADDVLPERALDGDPVARRLLVERIYEPLRQATSPLLTTLDAYWACGTAIEATSRTLFVHTNTVRYRLHRVEDLIGWNPTDPREGFVIRIGVALGRVQNSAVEREPWGAY